MGVIKSVGYEYTLFLKIIINWNAWGFDQRPKSAPGLVPSSQRPVSRSTPSINTPSNHILLTQQQCCNCFSCDRERERERGGGGAGGREWQGIAWEDLMQCFKPRWVTSVARNQQIWSCQVYTLYMSKEKKRKNLLLIFIPLLVFITFLNILITAVFPLWKKWRAYGARR